MESSQQTLTSYIHVSIDSHFPIQNIPFGAFIPNNDHLRKGRCGTRIGIHYLTS